VRPSTIPIEQGQAYPVPGLRDPSTYVPPSKDKRFYRPTPVDPALEGLSKNQRRKVRRMMNDMRPIPPLPAPRPVPPNMPGSTRVPRGAVLKPLPVPQLRSNQGSSSGNNGGRGLLETPQSYSSSNNNGRYFNQSW